MYVYMYVSRCYFQYDRANGGSGDYPNEILNL